MHDVPVSAHVPPGWPDAVPPPGAPGWERRAVSWLLDLCPADYRGYPLLGKQPRLLAYLAGQHVRASLDGVARATAGLRSHVAGQLDPQVVDDALAVLDAEQARLLAAVRAVDLVATALGGARYVPRL